MIYPRKNTEKIISHNSSLLSPRSRYQKYYISLPDREQLQILDLMTSGSSSMVKALGPRKVLLCSWILSSTQALGFFFKLLNMNRNHELSQDVWPSQVLKRLVSPRTRLPSWGLANQCGRSNAIAPFIGLCQESCAFRMPSNGPWVWLRTTISSHKAKHRLYSIPDLLHFGAQSQI